MLKYIIGAAGGWHRPIKPNRKKTPRERAFCPREAKKVLAWQTIDGLTTVIILGAPCRLERAVG